MRAGHLPHFAPVSEARFPAPDGYQWAPPSGAHQRRLWHLMRSVFEPSWCKRPLAVQPSALRRELPPDATADAVCFGCQGFAEYSAERAGGRP